METEPEGTYSICAGCGQQVDPADPDVQRWIPRRLHRSFGTPQIGEGLGELFHRGCFPGGDYRLDEERADLG
jgi:hypothetical protein